MNNPISISVVTPSYNQGPYIKDALESVASQNYPYLEHLVVDAGSRDQTLEVLKSFEHPKLNWTSEPDEGQSDGLNKGFKRAQADWILWLNADDYLWPGILEAYAEAISKDPDLNYLYGHTRFVDETGQTLKTVYEIPYHYRYSEHRLYIPPTSGSLFRRKLFMREPLDKNFHIIMDAEWFLRCGKTLKAKRLNRISNSFRVTDTNKTGPSIKTGQASERSIAEWRALHTTYTIDEDSTPARLAQGYYYLHKLRFGLDYLKQRLVGQS